MPDDPIAGQVVQGVLADGAESEHIQRQIVCSIQIAGVGVAPMMGCIGRSHVLGFQQGAKAKEENRCGYCDFYFHGEFNYFFIS